MAKITVEFRLWPAIGDDLGMVRNGAVKLPARSGPEAGTHSR